MGDAVFSLNPFVDTLHRATADAPSWSWEQKVLLGVAVVVCVEWAWMIVAAWTLTRRKDS